MARRLIGALLLPLLTLATPASANVGMASAVTGEPIGKPPSDAERVLHVGNDMAANEIVRTRGSDRVHIVFLDGSSLTVGPDSEIKIDHFVYDPEKKTGALTLNAGRGLFRYVGGAISKSSEVSVRTSGATLGIRGGIAVFSVATTGATTATLLFGGGLSMTSGGRTETTSQPGTQISAAANAPPSAPAPVPPGGLQSFDRAFSAPSTGTGNASIGLALGGSTFAQSNSGIPAAVARAAIPTTQQAQLNVARAQAAGPSTAGGPQPGAGPQQAAAPQQSAGPLQGAGPQQASAPLQASGPLTASTPLQAAGPLQNAGPLAAATPLQNVGPTQVSMALAGPTAGPVPNMPTIQVANLADGLARGEVGSFERLQNLLGSEQGRNAETLSNLVQAVSQAPGDSGGNRGGGEGRGSRPSVPVSPPVVLPPVVYDHKGPRNISQN